MKNTKKLFILLLLGLFLPSLVNAKIYFDQPVKKDKNVYEFKVRVENTTLNYIEGKIDVKNGKITDVSMSDGWKNETGNSNEFYFYHDGTKNGNYTIATFEVTITDNSKYEVNEFDYGIYKCYKDKYGNYFGKNSNIVSKNEFENTCSKDGDTKLKSLTISNGTLSPKFDPSSELYSATVENNIESVTFNAVPNKSTSKIIAGTKCSLKEGVNVCKIVVEAENKDTRTYQISVIRKNSHNTTASSNPNVSDFKVHGGTLTKEFKNSTKTYDVKVDKNTKEIYFTFTMDSNKDKYTSDVCKINEFTKSCKLTITAEDGVTKNIFTFNIIKDEQTSKDNDTKVEDKTDKNKTNSSSSTNNSSSTTNKNNSNASTKEDFVQYNPIEIEESGTIKKEEKPIQEENTESVSKKEIREKEEKDNTLFYGIVIILTLGIGIEIGIVFSKKKKNKNKKNNKKRKSTNK